jgi:hypothetical protein
MRINVLKCVFLLLLLTTVLPAGAQKLITYEAGMGTRDPNDADTWILYQRVRAEHDGMVLYADSALLNQVRNDLTAFGNVKIVITDTTTIFGDQLFYDGEVRVLDIWDDTVRLVDGKTVLKSDHLTYDRFASTASYDTWGITVNQDKRLVSEMGYYNSETKVFDIYQGVVLSDSNMRLETDTLTYCTETHLAEFWSPTHVYTDSTTMYSECGTYNTDERYAHSVKASEVHNGEKHLTCDTLHYYEETEFGIAIGHVVLTDTVNEIVSTSRYAETRQQEHTSLVTDSALVRMVTRDEEDTLATPDTVYVHADSIWVTNDSTRQFHSLRAYDHVKIYRTDAQAMCDSAYYSAPDSVLQLFKGPVLWYDHYQSTADTIVVHFDSAGAKQAFLNGGPFCVEQVDPEKYNQVKGRNMVVYFVEGEPDYADILGNAEMVYYIIDEDMNGYKSLVGVNVGVGSDMRIYFLDRAPDRVVTYGKPDMSTYPLDKLDEEKRTLDNFKWYDERRPKKPLDVFVW